MATRLIQDLVFAEHVQPPAFATAKRRPRGAKGLGLQYEREFVKQFPTGLHNPWFKFHDRNGPGLCSMDLLLQTPMGIVIWECKLTNTIEADMQLTGLYGPIVQHVYRTPVFGAVVQRHLQRSTDLRRVVTTLEEAQAHMAAGQIPILHWLGRTPLGA